MDSARSLDQRCMNHELIKSKPLRTRGARVLVTIFAKTRRAPAQSPPRTRGHLHETAIVGDFAMCSRDRCGLELALPDKCLPVRGGLIRIFAPLESILQ